MINTASDIWIEDVWIKLLHDQSVGDILRFGQTCRRNAQIATAKTLWLRILNRDVLSRCIPLPTNHRPFADLSGNETKLLVTHALKLHRENSFPESGLPAMISLNQSMPVTWVHIISGTWLVAAVASETRSILLLFSISVVAKNASTKPESQGYLDGPVSNGLVEVVSDGSVIIVLDLRSPTPAIEVVTLKQSCNGIMFARVGKYHGLSRIRALHRSWIGFALDNDLSIPSILNWKTGQVLHLRQSPDTDGSAMAMAMYRDNVVVITPRKMHVHKVTLETLSGKVHEESVAHRLPKLAAFVRVAFVKISLLGHKPDRISVRVCTSSRSGIRVYSIPLEELYNVSGRSHFEHPLWSLDVPAPVSRSYEWKHWNEYKSDPMFGKSLATISWLEGLHGGGDLQNLRPMSFATLTTGLAEGSEQLGMSVRRLSGLNMPALHAVCTRDYDDGLGLLVFGNILGELAVYQLAGIDLNNRGGYLEQPSIPTYDGSDLLSLVPIEAHDEPTFLLGGIIRDPTDAEVQACKDEICKQRPAKVPEEWSTDFFDTDESTGEELLGSLAWRFENICHFLGRPTPLMHKDNDIIFTAGGLHFIYVFEYERMFQILPDTDLNDFAAHWEPYITETRMQGLPDESGGIWSTGKLQTHWAWEVTLHQRNRWDELKARGGTVPTYWLDRVPEARLFR